MGTANFALTLICVALFTCTHAKIGYFWHITDFHYDPLYTASGDTRRQCRRAEERGSSGHHRALGRYGDYACDSPLELIESAARYMRTRHADNVEFVLWTGDIIASRFTGNEADRLQAIRTMTDLLRGTFSSHFVFPALGHTDPLPSEWLTNLWMKWLPLEALQTFQKDGYYTIEQTQSKLRIVALNTNLFGAREASTPRAARQWSWLYQVLETATANQEMRMSTTISVADVQVDNLQYDSGQYDFVVPATTRNKPLEADQWSTLWNMFSEDQVYIVGHAAPGSDLRVAYDAYAADANTQYLELVRKYARVIAGQFFGHLHADTFRVFYDNDRPVSWAFLAPSMSPHRDPVGSSNPGLRLYKFDINTGKVLDYTQYYLDLAVANRGIVEWQPEYNLTQYYGLHDVSANALHNLADKMRYGLPHEIATFSRYLRAYSVKYETSELCDGACAHQHYCAITCSGLAAYSQCVEAAASALAAASRSATLVAEPIAMLATLLMLVFVSAVCDGFLVLVKKSIAGFKN